MTFLHVYIAIGFFGLTRMVWWVKDERFHDLRSIYVFITFLMIVALWPFVDWKHNGKRS